VKVKKLRQPVLMLLVVMVMLFHMATPAYASGSDAVDDWLYYLYEYYWE
jgi:hypothetical protein